jgi:hypothetical protein
MDGARPGTVDLARYGLAYAAATVAVPVVVLVAADLPYQLPLFVLTIVAVAGALVVLSRFRDAEGDPEGRGFLSRAVAEGVTEREGQSDGEPATAGGFDPDLRRQRYLRLAYFAGVFAFAWLALLLVPLLPL